MKINFPILYITTILVAGWGAVTDLRFGKIYNRLTMPSILVGIFLNLILNGINGLFNSLLGIILGMTCILFWILGMLKAGDVKLYMAIGALGGWKFCGYTIISSILVGGIVAFIVMIVRKDGFALLRRIWIYLLNLFYTRRFYPYQPEEKSAYFSFGGCIFAGVLISVWYLCFS